MSPLTVSLIQPDLIWEDKAANLALLEKMIMGLQDKTELVVIPEMFNTGFSMNAEKLGETMEGEGVAWMRRIAAKKKCILTGSLMIREKEGDPCFNRLIWMLPDGQLGYYDKRHLFGYGKEDRHYLPGRKKLIGSVKGWKVNLKICYDLRFPVWLRQDLRSGEAAAEPEYDLLVVVANWPASRVLAWDTLLRARAIENQCYVVAVNRAGTDGNGLVYPGHSVVYGPLGEPLLVADANPGSFTLTLSRESLEETRTKFPFWRDADHFLIQS
jgi:omega-amidase